MKNLLIFLFWLGYEMLQAQIPATNFTVNGQTFLVRDLEVLLAVENAQSPIKSGAVIHNGIPNPDCYKALSGFARDAFYTFEYRKEDFIRFTNILREVFPQSRATALGIKQSIDIDFTINPQGQILEIKYTFDKDLVITTAELALLDKRLKESMFFTFKPNHVCSSSNVISLQSQWISFGDLYSPYGFGVGPFWEDAERRLREMIEEGEDPRN